MEFLIRGLVTDEELEDVMVAPKGSKKDPIVL